MLNSSCRLKNAGLWIAALCFVCTVGTTFTADAVAGGWENLPVSSSGKAVKLDHLNKLTKAQAIAQGTADAQRDAARTQPKHARDNADKGGKGDNTGKADRGELLLVNAVYVNPNGPFKAGFFGGCAAPDVGQFVHYVRTTKYLILDAHGATASPFAEDYEDAYNAETRAIAKKRYGQDVFERIDREGKAAFDHYMNTQPPPNRIAYIVDASAVASPYLEDMVAVVKRNVEKMDPEQCGLSLVFAMNGKAKDAVEGTSKQATPKRIAETFARIEQGMGEGKFKLKAEGHADMLKAIALALEYKPRLILIMTTDVRGNGPKQPTRKRFLAKLDELLKEEKQLPRINVLQWVQADPTGTGEAVATKYGYFRHVTADDVKELKSKGSAKTGGDK